MVHHIGAVLFLLSTSFQLSSAFSNHEVTNASVLQSSPPRAGVANSFSFGTTLCKEFQKNATASHEWFIIISSSVDKLQPFVTAFFLTSSYVGILAVFCWFTLLTAHVTRNTIIDWGWRLLQFLLSKDIVDHVIDRSLGFAMLFPRGWGFMTVYALLLEPVHAMQNTGQVAVGSTVLNAMAAMSAVTIVRSALANEGGGRGHAARKECNRCSHNHAGVTTMKRKRGKKHNHTCRGVLAQMKNQIPILILTNTVTVMLQWDKRTVAWYVFMIMVTLCLCIHVSLTTLRMYLSLSTLRM